MAGTLTGTFLQFDQATPNTGHVLIVPSVPTATDSSGILVGTIRVTLDAAGAFSAEVPGFNEVGVDPQGITYTVIPRLTNGTPAWITGLRVDDGETVDVGSATPIDPALPVYDYQQWIVDLEAATATAEVAEDGATTAKDAAVVARAAAVAAAALAVDISNISVPDDVVTTLAGDAVTPSDLNTTLTATYAGRAGALLRDVTAPEIGVLANGVADDSDAVDALIDSLPDFVAEEFGPDLPNNFNVSGVSVLNLPPVANLLLERQIVIPSTKAFGLHGPVKGGARVTYTGAKLRTDGAMTAGDKTLAGSLFAVHEPGVDIAVRGAGPGGSTLVTWIQTITNDGSVELAHAASTTVGPNATYVVAFSAFRRGGVVADKRGIPYSFKNLTMNGGLCFANGTKPVVVEDVTFNETLGPPLTALNKPSSVGGDPLVSGTSSVTYQVHRVQINHCWGGLWHTARTAGLSNLMHVRFLALRDIGIVAESGFTTAYDIDFQGMEEGIGATMPFVWFPSANESSGRAKWDVVRYGSEEFIEGGIQFRHPFAPMVVGPLGSATADSSGHRPEFLTLGQVWFGGSDDPTDTSAKHAIVLNMRIDGLNIESGRFLVYKSVLIQENWVDAVSGTTRDAITGRNTFNPAVQISDSHTAGIFSHGGVDWRPQPIAQRLSTASEWRPRQNLLPHSNKFTNATWTKTLCSVAQDATGPDGVASSAFTLTRTATGTARVRQTIAAGFTVGEPLVFSVWAKAGTHDVMALGVQATDISGDTQQLAANLKPIKLSSRWERYRVVCPYVPATAGIEVAVFHDVGNSAETGGTILIFGAQLEHGLEVSPMNDNPSSTIVDPLPFQSLILGNNRITYGTAAPTTGRHEAGGQRINIAPAVGAPEKWVCTVAGSPGTWEPVGSVGFQTATTAQLTAVADAVNTTNKRAGKMVWNSTTNRPCWASGPLAADVWYTTTGSGTLTPV